MSQYTHFSRETPRPSCYSISTAPMVFTVAYSAAITSDSMLELGKSGTRLRSTGSAHFNSLRNPRGSRQLHLEFLWLSNSARLRVDMCVSVVVVPRTLLGFVDLVLKLELVVALLDVCGDGLSVAD